MRDFAINPLELPLVALAQEHFHFPSLSVLTPTTHLHPVILGSGSNKKGEEKGKMSPAH